MNSSVVSMLLRCHEIAREHGRNYSTRAFEELVNYMGLRLGINPNPCGLTQETVKQLDKELSMNEYASTIGDHLGEVFAKLELGNKALGQCLTPMTVADCMVAMNGCADLKPGQKILDPCTGTGVFLIAAAKVIAPQVELCGVELDPMLYRATLVQLTVFTAYGHINPFYLLNADFLADELDWSQANHWQGGQGIPRLIPTPVLVATPKQRLMRA